MRGLTEKYLLRKVAGDWLPPEITARVKRPYRAPIRQAFFNPATRESIDDLLSPGRVQETAIFNPAAVVRLVQKARAEVPLGEIDEMALVGIISTQLLHDRFMSSFNMPSPLSESDRVKVCFGPHPPSARKRKRV